MGHLTEMCLGAELGAQIYVDRVPLLPTVLDYLAQGCVPGGTVRNFDSYGHYLAPMSETHKHLLCDPQTSGGLLVAVSATHQQIFETQFQHLDLRPIGQFKATEGIEIIEVI